MEITPIPSGDHKAAYTGKMRLPAGRAAAAGLIRSPRRKDRKSESEE